MPTVHDLTQAMPTDVNTDIDLLIQTPEYRDPNSIKGQQYREIVRQSYELKFGNADLTRRPNPIVLDTSTAGTPIRPSMRWG